VAAIGTLWREVGPLARRLRDRKVCRSAGRRFVEGRLGDVQVVLTATGEGAGLATEGTEDLLQRFPVDRLIGLGIAGGLTPDLEAGAVLVAGQVREGEMTVTPPDKSWSDAVLGRTATVGGTVVSSARIASDPVAKAEVWRRSAGEGSGVVDLESAAVARVAAAEHLPYLMIRAVSDTADEALPLDFERFRKRDGRIAQARVLFEALRRPALWRPLLRLRSRVRRCAESLAEVAEEAMRP
jgi:adenosylhomocysteine nucleosidase